MKRINKPITHVVSTRLNDEERKILRSIQKHLGMKTAEALRWLVITRVKRKKKA